MNQPEPIPQTTTPIHTVVIYHGNCRDGFGAAWAVSRRFGFDGVKYIPTNYGQPIPPEAYDAHRVAILDFSYSRTELEKLNMHTAELIVLDHHKSAQDELEGLPYAYFDSERSGAVMAYEYFCSGPVPELLLYVQDRDLWRWEMLDSRELNEALENQVALDFGEWDYIAENWQNQKADLVNTGDILLEAKAMHTERLASKPIWLNIDNHIVPTVNCPLYQSEIAEALYLKHPEAPFAAVWYTKPDGATVWSLRSDKRLKSAELDKITYDVEANYEAFDVGALAESFGGGGHRQSAGFRLPSDAPANFRIAKAPTVRELTNN